MANDRNREMAVPNVSGIRCRLSTRRPFRRRMRGYALAFVFVSLLFVLGGCTSSQSSSAASTQTSSETATASRPAYQVDLPEDIANLVEQDALATNGSNGPIVIERVMVYAIHDDTVSISLTTNAPGDDGSIDQAAVEQLAEMVAADLATYATITDENGNAVTADASGLGALYDVYDLELECSDNARTYELEGDKLFNQTTVNWNQAS